MSTVALLSPAGISSAIVGGVAYPVTSGLVTVPTIYLSELLEAGFTLACPVVQGIQFPATAVPSSDVNRLDDYKEGTFQPSLKLGGAATAMTYGTRTGRYTKVGNLVSFTIHIILTALGSSTGALTIEGMPYSPAVAAEFMHEALIVGTGRNLASQTTTILTLTTDAGVALDDKALGATSEIIVKGSYQVA